MFDYIQNWYNLSLRRAGSYQSKPYSLISDRCFEFCSVISHQEGYLCL